MNCETLRDCFKESFHAQGQKNAIIFQRNDRIETEISYLKLSRDVNRMANILKAIGVAKGDRVVFFVEKCLLLVIAHLALQKMGAISVPLNPGFKKSELEYLLADSNPKLVLCGIAQKEIVRKINPQLNVMAVDARIPYQALDFLEAALDVAWDEEIHPDDPGVIIYTSGTTGKPKGAVLTQRNLVHDAKNIIKIWEITGTDVLCHALPLFHIHGLCFALHTSLMTGASVLMLDQFSPDNVIAALKKKTGDYVCSVFMAVPTMYSRLMDAIETETPDFSHMRLWTSGSAPLLVKDFERLKKVFGQEPVEREGMSETGMNFSNPLRGKRKAGSIGLPLPVLRVRIVNPETFQDVEAGQTGEIWLQGPGITPGYWEKPEETSKAFEQGWFKTGDLGKVDDEGYFYLTDRIKHIIISGGENISPKEVESVLNQIENVVESSVVGIPDEKWGERVVAAVVGRSGSNLVPQELQNFCKEHLHNWKCPKEIVFVKELPKNTMGKVLKEEVKKLFGD